LKEYKDAIATPTRSPKRLSSIMNPASRSSRLISHSTSSARLLQAGRRQTKQISRPFITVIQQGHEGWRLSLGRNPVKLNPGLRIALPIYHTVMNVDMRESSANIKNLTAYTSDNVPVTVAGSLFFRVKDSYHACFSVNEVHNNVKSIGTSAIRSVIGYFSYDDVIADRNKINARLHDVIGDSISKWGIECTRFEIQDFHPSNRDVEKQLELQMAAERERRKQILDTQALVNVAEGHKQRAILESEANLQSQLNAAAGHKQSSILESEGMREAVRNEGEALSLQVKILAEALSGSPDPNETHLLKALDAVLEVRRLEQLKAIASGPGNSTYFFGEAKGAGRDPYTVENMEKWKKQTSTSAVLVNTS